jgi:hypothetical protein
MHAQHEDSGSWTIGGNLTGGKQTVDLRQSAIHHDYGWEQLAGELDCGGAVACLADNLNLPVILKQSPQAPEHKRVFIHQ